MSSWAVGQTVWRFRYPWLSVAVLYITDVTDNNNNTHSISSFLLGAKQGDNFLICYNKTLLSLFFLFFLLDGHHLWETEAKVDKDASKPVSNTYDIIIITSLVSFQDESGEEKAAVFNHFNWTKRQNFSIATLKLDV